MYNQTVLTNPSFSRCLNAFSVECEFLVNFPHELTIAAQESKELDLLGYKSPEIVGAVALKVSVKR